MTEPLGVISRAPLVGSSALEVPATTHQAPLPNLVLLLWPVSGFNVSHTIHHISFGAEYPGRVNPLDNKVGSRHTPSQPVTRVRPRQCVCAHVLVRHVRPPPHHAGRLTSQGQAAGLTPMGTMWCQVKFVSEEVGTGLYQYFIKVIPTNYKGHDGKGQRRQRPQASSAQAGRPCLGL